MLKRHGTRLDIGTAEDVAELNAAEALLRVSYKPTSMGTASTGSSSGMGGGYGAVGGMGQAGGDVAGPHARSAAGSYGLPGAMARSAAATGTTAGGGGVRVGDAPSSATITPAMSYTAGMAPPPPHVHLGRASPVTAPTPASSASSASVHAQRALYRGGTAESPSGRTTAASTATGYTPSSSSGRTPAGAGAGAGGRRGTAQPLFHPQRSGEVGEDEVGEEEEEEARGRPSMMRAPFSIPVPAAAASSSSGAGGVARFPGAPPPHASSSSAYGRRGVPSAGPPRYGAAPGIDYAVDVDEEEEEEVPARPSRVSGRYQLPRSPAHGDPSAS